MHEMALMGDILNIVGTNAKNQSIRKVNKVHLIVGDLSNALPDALEMAFDIYKRQGIDFLNEYSQLVIHREEAKAICSLCQREYVPDQRIAVCPECHIPTGRLISGETFKVDSYEGE
ncbi:Hydrogenase-3 nickel incorporation protein HypA [Schinkia azotoformans MEV2011]|uniref:Hydrogenase expression/synthesis HypA n=2 Tax=Schinkia azotoformans TaxID=1454 RepID=K6DJ36_SCHAZ|nr:hydrogenase maturation nickel metallochaperone HypA [Schinkia azotoformans]EKN68334.1 hydrogenase expression/synthesis HypA [Schinkia azotoformans LMG 9581]KEF37299.1 Hydrogenase-3 nickel incorporation protein HypA [Schinkia azotoformans MEV2011]MEC1638552.1 hydrogenase maturation nickel metallochaperone HypA [Schinkia azotoformans]MEC1697557.1 hydrogenase maturation nickel metallochaperone HypA [Schinkia azotoformans]MEC1722756.1 hydrogenase maturation nickel metallochaperone HypA [Schinki